MKKTILTALLFCCAAFGAFSAEYRSKVYLNGVWECAFSKTNTLPANAVWQPVKVPSSWGVWGRDREFQFPNYVNNALYCFYKTPVNVPAEWKGKRLKLVFEFIAEGYQVCWNGTPVATSPTKNFWEEILIPAELVRYGEKNELSVRTYNSLAVTSRQGRLAGIPRDVLLYALPDVSIQYAHAIPSVRQKKLDVRTYIQNFTGKDADVELRASVLDNGKTVLTLPAVKGKVGKEGELKTAKAWADPILWGYGKYGKAHLYQLKTELFVNGKLSDVKYDRFGFREFRTQKDKFLLNEKEIYIKGDVSTVTSRHNEYIPAAITYYQWLRDTGFNLHRLHTDCNFDPSAWFVAADELGFLVETETWRFNSVLEGKGRENANILLANDPLVKKWWGTYVKANYNHPSIVFWCIDNEQFSVGDTSPANLRKIDQTKMRAHDELSKFIRTLDPTRIVEINHNLSLYPFVKLGKFSKESFQVYNYHPYGNLEQAINREIKVQGFKGEVPILIGEIFGFGKINDFQRNPKGLYAEQWRVATSLYRQIHQAASCKYVSGVITCGQSGDGRFGFTREGKLNYGPWDRFARNMKNGKENGIFEFKVIPRYPSLSGPGVKVDEIWSWRYYGGWFLYNINWFDPTVPAYSLNIVDDSVKKALKEITGNEPPPLPAKRKPELVAAVGKANAGKMVFLYDNNHPGALDGVVADPDGTAYFRLPGIGKYRVVCGKESREVTVSAEPALTKKPGYDYLTWVDFTNGESTALKANLKKGAEIVVFGETTKKELVKNNDLEYWHLGKPTLWILNNKVVRSDDAKSGKYSAKTIYNGALIQVIALDKGKNYRLSCYAKRIKGNGKPEIQVNSWGFKKLASAQGTGSDKWEHLTVDFKFTGGERYIYFRGTGISHDSEMLFDSISLQEIVSQAGQEPLNAGPFALDKDGYILHYLAVGPFPNQGDALHGYEAAKTDYLKEHGGEANYKPLYTGSVTAEFKPGFFWTPGKYKLHWQQLHMTRCNENIPLQLDAAQIKGIPVNNVAAYLACELVSPAEKQVQFGLNSDDGYVLYLNGKKVGEFLGNRGATPKVDNEKFTVTLQKGKNLLLAKSIQEGGEWNFLCRVLNMDGTPCKDVKVQLMETPNRLRDNQFTGLAAGKNIGKWSPSKGFKVQKFNGMNAINIPGSTGQCTTIVNVKPGEKYRISAWVWNSRPWAGKGYTGSIAIRTTDYKFLVHAKANNRVGEWEYLQGDCVIPEGKKQVYFYLMNFYIPKDHSIWYALPRMEKIEEAK